MFNGKVYDTVYDRMLQIFLFYTFPSFLMITLEFIDYRYCHVSARGEIEL